MYYLFIHFSYKILLAKASLHPSINTKLLSRVLAPAPFFSFLHFGDSHRGSVNSAARLSVCFSINLFPCQRRLDDAETDSHPG